MYTHAYIYIMAKTSMHMYVLRTSDRNHMTVGHSPSHTYTCVFVCVCIYIYTCIYNEGEMLWSLGKPL